MRAARLAARNPSGAVPATRRNADWTSAPIAKVHIPFIVGGIAIFVPWAYYLVDRSNYKRRIAKDGSKVPVSEKISGGTTRDEIRDNSQATSSGDSKGDASKSIKRSLV
ncbi:hypothetical protein FS842_008997 [Serendipita sp. 407]|nr:hypothetical protein FRC15_006411 [Serendipita sp. 397]KAG9056971.1 hypothetical protein FS842_008997 [Serendipita sp. 407]